MYVDKQVQQLLILISWSTHQIAHATARKQGKDTKDNPSTRDPVGHPSARDNHRQRKHLKQVRPRPATKHSKTPAQRAPPSQEYLESARSLESAPCCVEPRVPLSMGDGTFIRGVPCQRPGVPLWELERDARGLTLVSLRPMDVRLGRRPHRRNTPEGGEPLPSHLKPRRVRSVNVQLDVCGELRDPRQGARRTRTTSTTTNKLKDPCQIEAPQERQKHPTPKENGRPRKRGDATRPSRRERSRTQL